ncbi:HutD family protein [Cryobacterium sp. RTC2.1]|uniref:HutD/Ves family protein n=1 Tax=Cryobacterium sp. RTC2.1 TaxID=3048634 RepID=UPI002B225692|nr:HutD family protein [Cryobacterium sp. RTC2.1]MEB0001751.1 HutD family protein [Cryobacterium sp. RTC2.1]
MPPEQRSDAVSRASARVPVAWRNGGGWTSTVAVAPPAATMDDFDWRVSIATIAGDSAFSEFAGIDRYLVPLSAAGLDLTIDGTLQHISQYEVCAFPGESLVSSTGSAESSDDLNLMLRRTAATGSLRVERLTDPLSVMPGPDESVLVVVLEGEVEIDGAPGTDSLALGLRDAMLVAPGQSQTLRGEAIVALASTAVRNIPSVPDITVT